METTEEKMIMDLCRHCMVIIKHSRRRFREIVWYFLVCILNIRRETIADSITAAAIAPTIAPTNAAVLMPDFEEVEPPATLKSTKAILYGISSLDLYITHLTVGSIYRECEF